MVGGGAEPAAGWKAARGGSGQDRRARQIRPRTVDLVRGDLRQWQRCEPAASASAAKARDGGGNGGGWRQRGGGVQQQRLRWR